MGVGRENGELIFNGGAEFQFSKLKILRDG